MNIIPQAFATGYESLSAWSDLLDRINVFPVADGDTGANLRISLAPLRDCVGDRTRTRDLLARCATGNSGNIAAAFFQEFYQSKSVADLAEHAARGRDKAWQALAKPQAGTMLTVFDKLAVSLDGQTDPLLYPVLCKELQEAVRTTSQTLPDLRLAGVVDSGALGMYIFFEGFFRQLTAQTTPPPSILELFNGSLTVSPDFHSCPSDCFCVNALIHTGDNHSGNVESLAEFGESVVMLPAESGIKVHIHTADRQQLRTRLSALGEIVNWSDEAMDTGGLTAFATPQKKQAIHIMTDGAGSMTRELARQHGITLLDSYILAEEQSRPESLYSPAEIYSLMREGAKVTTAQASIYERHQHYESVCQQFGRTLYLCVGSAFTGNHDVAQRWKEKNDPHNLLEIVDTGAASGKLALIALLAARYAEQASSPEDVIAFAHQIMRECEEYVFIDQLQFLAAGGRVSRTKGFFADMLQMKPVISSANNEVRKVGVVHSKKGQLAFALKRLKAGKTVSVLLLQYSDNQEWIRETVQPQVCELLPGAEILIVPLSLTSGVHMGPGTWSVAWTGSR